jgi:hypothetical protein
MLIQISDDVDTTEAARLSAKVLGLCKKGWMQNIVSTDKVRLTQMINTECIAHMYSTVLLTISISDTYLSRSIILHTFFTYKARAFLNLMTNRIISILIKY